MKVIMMSASPTENPYIKLLTKSLEAKGVAVHFPPIGRFYMIRAALSHGRPDIVHLQWQHGYFSGATLFKGILSSISFFAQVLALRAMGVRFVWTVHNLVNHERALERWELLMSRLLAKSVCRLIVHCPAVVSRVSEAYKVDPQQIRVVPHGNYRGAYPDPIVRNAARANLGLDPKAIVLLFFGLIRGYKGVEQLLGAFGELSSPNTRLVLAGRPRPPELGSALAQRARLDPRISVHFDFIPDDELVAYLSACDVVVLPYRDSLTSGAAILAASYGRPIIAPNVGCMSELPAKAAFLYDPDSPDGLGEALRRALTTPLRAMGVAAQEYVEQFPWSLVSEKTIEVYTEALSQSQ
jgi:beta-1,4-mannosyltransferase